MSGKVEKSKEVKKILEIPRTAYRINESVFLLELLMTETERRLASDLRANPNDESTINAYIDYLKEQGRYESAELVEKGHIPGAQTLNSFLGTPGIAASGHTTLTSGGFWGR